MSTEPEREIEKTLKAYARKRQLQARAQFELKQSARQRLKREVALMKSEAAEPSGWWPQLLGSLWLRVAATAAVILVGTGLLLRPGFRAERPTTELAKNDAAPTPRTERETRSAAAPAA